MAAYGTESIPSTWDDERDDTFFRITASLFSSEFAYGAGVLLASYDVEMDTASAPSPATAVTVTSTTPSPARRVTAQ